MLRLSWPRGGREMHATFHLALLPGDAATAAVDSATGASKLSNLRIMAWSLRANAIVEARQRTKYWRAARR